MKIVEIVLVPALCVFAVFAFAQWNLNPGAWSGEARIFCATFAALAVCARAALDAGYKL